MHNILLEYPLEQLPLGEDMDLASYAEEHALEDGRRKRCVTCSLKPEVLAQVHAGRAREPQPIPYSMICKWLEAEHGVRINLSTLRYHFIAGHDHD